MSSHVLVFRKKKKTDSYFQINTHLMVSIFAIIFFWKVIYFSSTVWILLAIPNYRSKFITDASEKEWPLSPLNAA